jgi:hypothetical protein
MAERGYLRVTAVTAATKLAGIVLKYRPGPVVSVLGELGIRARDGAMEISATGNRGGPSPLVPNVDARVLMGIERRAWFDLNGDGRIENTSSMMGGDGYLIGDGDGDGRVATGEETWYDAHGRPVPPPPPGSESKVASRPPASAPSHVERAREVAARTYAAN